MDKCLKMYGVILCHMSPESKDGTSSKGSGLWCLKWSHGSWKALTGNSEDSQGWLCNKCRSHKGISGKNSLPVN